MENPWENPWKTHGKPIGIWTLVLKFKLEKPKTNPVTSIAWH
jgi:hypothetical protein